MTERQTDRHVCERVTELKINIFGQKGGKKELEKACRIFPFVMKKRKKGLCVCVFERCVEVCVFVCVCVCWLELSDKVTRAFS